MSELVEDYEKNGNYTFKLVKFIFIADWKH